MEFEFNSNENCAKMQAQLNSQAALIPAIVGTLLKMLEYLNPAQRKEVMAELVGILSAASSRNFYGSALYNEFLSEQISNLLKNSGVDPHRP